MKINTKNKKEELKKKNKINNISKFKSLYFDFYDDIKTTPKQDWWFVWQFFTNNYIIFFVKEELNENSKRI